MNLDEKAPRLLRFAPEVERGYVGSGLSISEPEFRSKVLFFHIQAQRSNHPPAQTAAWILATHNTISLLTFQCYDWSHRLL